MQFTSRYNIVTTLSEVLLTHELGLLRSGIRLPQDRVISQHFLLIAAVLLLSWAVLYRVSIVTDYELEARGSILSGTDFAFRLAVGPNEPLVSGHRSPFLGCKVAGT